MNNISNYATLSPGLYKNRSTGFLTIWDVRIKSPNRGEYLSPGVLHSIQHTMYYSLIERFGRFRVIGVFPLGSQTGFCILTRFIDSYLIYEAIVDYIVELQTETIIPGASSLECGQYTLHDLRGAKDEMMKFYQEIKYHNSARKYN